MSESLQLSELQHAVMRVLWQLGEATVQEVRAALDADERPLAATTVATLLQRLCKRGVAAHRSEGRQYVYRAVVSEAEVRDAMVGGLADTLFEGDLASLVCHLLRADDMAPGDVARVRALIESRERELRERGEESR